MNLLRSIRSFIGRDTVTIGVRAAIIDQHDRVLLVRHTYTQGWYFPGGGVECGETMDEALARELREEVNVELVGPAVLFGAYLNINVSPRDHVMFYLAREFSVSGPKRPNLEIAAAQWFPIADPPPGTTTATRRRLREITGHKPVVPKW